MSSANFKLKRTAAASRGFLATARFSCTIYFVFCVNYYSLAELLISYTLSRNVVCVILQNRLLLLMHNTTRHILMFVYKVFIVIYLLLHVVLLNLLSFLYYMNRFVCIVLSITNEISQCSTVVRNTVVRAV